MSVHRVQKVLLVTTRAGKGTDADPARWVQTVIDPETGAMLGELATFSQADRSLSQVDHA